MLIFCLSYLVVHKKIVEFGGPKGGSSKTIHHKTTISGTSQSDQEIQNGVLNQEIQTKKIQTKKYRPEENTDPEPSSEELDCYDLNGNPMPCEGQAEGAPTGEYADDCYDPNGNLIPCAGNEVSSEPSVCFDPVTNEEIPCEIGTGGGGDRVHQTRSI